MNTGVRERTDINYEVCHKQSAAGSRQRRHLDSHSPYTYTSGTAPPTVKCV